MAASHSAASHQDVTISRSRVIRLVLAAVLIGVAAFLLLYRLDYYPHPWYDEGSHLRVAKNYALNGIYADYSSEGLRFYGPAVGVGPTVLLPIATMFSAFGVSIPLARLVIAGYGLLALLALYLLGRRLLPPGAAVLAVVLVLLSPGIDFIYNSRTVLGEVPGIFFLALGLWLWLKPGPLSIPHLFGVGGLMGLACVTKNQYALFILPSMGLLWLTNLVWYRSRHWREFIIPGVTAGVIFAAWTYIVLIALGEQGDMAANLATLRSSAAGAFFLINSAAMERVVSFLIDGTALGGLFIPSFLYALFISLRRNETGQQYGMVFTFLAMGTLLYATSLGWPRYAFAPLALTAFMAVRLFQDLTQGFKINWRSLVRTLRNDPPNLSVLTTLLLIGWLVGVVALPLLAHVHAVTDHGHGNAYEMAAYMTANIDSSALIETWEPEMGVLTDHNYHYPPQIVLAHSVAEKWFYGPHANTLYDFRDSGTPDYVLVGEFAKYTLIYPDERLENYELVHSIGAYDLYHLKN